MFGECWMNEKETHSPSPGSISYALSQTHIELHVIFSFSFFVFAFVVLSIYIYVYKYVLTYVWLYVCVHSFQRWRREERKKWVNYKKRKTSFLGVSFSATAYHVYLHTNNGKERERETKEFISFAFFAFPTTTNRPIDAHSLLTFIHLLLLTCYMRTVKF